MRTFQLIAKTKAKPFNAKTQIRIHQDLRFHFQQITLPLAQAALCCRA
ncbi:hypothetical protein SEHO0A_02148 [Salmonella enterica subsp. houtenae str. ATCC BAA-1581]|nr:hypothetical protein SEHO0A_02148 [Salmonella enterica subsp. houtenae str. ATCC BAA-1581]